MKKILTVVLAAVMLAVGVNAAFEKVNTYSNNFSDVTESNWFFENVKTAYELGFMNGKSEGKFDPNGNVTVAEGITMAARLHAIYNGTEVKKKEAGANEYRIDFDDPSYLVDLSQRNSRNTNGVNPYKATAKIEDGVLVVTAVQTDGRYDPQLQFNGLELPAKDYDKITVRMKRDPLDDHQRDDYIEFYYSTNINPGISANRQVNISYYKLEQDLSEWFEISQDVGKHSKWSDIITGFRFDPSNDNGIYYIDYIVFSKSENIQNEKWYDMYVDYAIENGIIKNDTFKSAEYTRNITRAEICDMFAAAIPEDSFAPINDINGIPDVLRDEKNADVYLMLYKAGIVLGDASGNFNPKADIKRSEIAAIINRVALPENRVKGTVNADWDAQGNEYDIEFNDDSWLEKLKFEATSVKIVDDALVLESLDKGAGQPSRFDSKIMFNDIKIDAAENTKLKVRFKAELAGESGNTDFDLYFATEEDPSYTENKSIHADMFKNSYIDAAGWYVLEYDLAAQARWKGNIISYRFDPTNTKGVFTIDYIRFIKADPLLNASHEALLANGYTAKKLLQDPHWENGFYVDHYQHGKVDLEQRLWKDYSDNNEKPVWDVAPLWSGLDLWENRDTTTDKYTLKDTAGVNTIKYNPEEKSISLHLDATKVFKGEPCDSKKSWWPHLLLDQDYQKYKVDPENNTAGADRIFVEVDVRVVDFKDTTNPEGTNAFTFQPYFYLLSKTSPGQKIWFGVGLFSGMNASSNKTPGWSPDSAAHQYIYGIPTAVTYGGVQNSFNPEKGVIKTGEEWKHVRVDITPHIERCVEWANRDNAFGIKVTKDDLYFSGCNVGFEIWGNYDITIEIKNLEMIAYNKA